MNKWAGRAMVVAGTAGMVYGVYLMAGKGWAILAGSFIVYVAGYHLTQRRAVSEAQERFDEAHARVSDSIREAREAEALRVVAEAKNPRRREVRWRRGEPN